MFNNKGQMPAGHQNKGANTVESSLHGLANMLAFIAAFMVAPQLFSLTSDPVFDYLYNSYDEEFIAHIGVWIWTGLATTAVYFFCRAMFVLALILISQRLVFLFA